MIKKAAFKARALNKSILENKSVIKQGRKSAQPKTKFVPFDLHTDQRSIGRERKSLAQSDE